MAFKSGQLKKLPVNDGEMKRVSLGLLSGEVKNSKFKREGNDKRGNNGKSWSAAEENVKKGGRGRAP